MSDWAIARRVVVIPEQQMPALIFTVSRISPFKIDPTDSHTWLDGLFCIDWLILAGLIPSSLTLSLMR